MKVAIVINTSWNIYNFRLGLIKALIKNNHDVIAIAPKDSYTDKLIQLGCQYLEVKMDNQGVNPFKDLSLIARLYRTYGRTKPDVIFQYTIKPNIYGSIVAGMLGIPAINNVSGLGTVFLKDNILATISKMLYKFSFRHPFKVFFQNADDQKLFIDLNLVNKDKTAVIPGSGVDLNQFAVLPKPKNQFFTFLLISRIIQDKGIREFIAAIKMLKQQNFDAKFQILGAKDPYHKRGIPLDEIQSWIDEDLIEYLGVTENVSAAIAGANCIVLPSYREGTPKTLLEAASCGRPLIATDVPGCREVVVDRFNGLLCRARDAEDLSEKIREMRDFDLDTLQTMAINSRKLVEKKFDESIVVNKYLQTISILDKN